jgi:hypothetical protein
VSLLRLLHLLRSESGNSLPLHCVQQDRQLSKHNLTSRGYFIALSHEARAVATRDALNQRALIVRVFQRCV